MRKPIPKPHELRYLQSSQMTLFRVKKEYYLFDHINFEISTIVKKRHGRVTEEAFYYQFNFCETFFEMLIFVQAP